MLCPIWGFCRFLYDQALSADEISDHRNRSRGFVPGAARECRCSGQYRGQFCEDYEGTFATTTSSVTQTTQTSTTDSSTTTTATDTTVTDTTATDTTTTTASTATGTVFGCSSDHLDPAACKGQACVRPGVRDMCPALCGRCQQFLADLDDAAARATAQAEADRNAAIATYQAQLDAATTSVTPTTSGSEASASAGSGGSEDARVYGTVLIIVVVVALIIIIALVGAVFVYRQGAQRSPGGATDARASSFENPMYGQVGVNGASPSRDQAVYTVPAMSTESTGYMDVAPTGAASGFGDPEEDV